MMVQAGDKMVTIHRRNDGHDVLRVLSGFAVPALPTSATSEE